MPCSLVDVLKSSRAVSCNNIELKTDVSEISSVSVGAENGDWGISKMLVFSSTLILAHVFAVKVYGRFEGIFSIRV
jgi:hypothetical protein